MLKQTSVLAAAVMLASQAMASGFKINEQSASGAGRAFAGSAAVANDASVVFFNPAGMSRLEKSQASFGFTYLNLEGKFDGVRTNPTGQVTSENAEAGVYNDGGDFMPNKVIPFGYYVHKLDDKAAVGLGILLRLALQQTTNKVHWPVVSLTKPSCLPSIFSQPSRTS